MSDERDSVSRRDLIRTAGVVSAATILNGPITSAAEPKPTAAASPPPAVCKHPFLTPADDFYDVSRGTPKPHSLVGEAQKAARLTGDTWRLEITADPFVEKDLIKVPASVQTPRTIAAGNAIDLPALLELGKKHEVKYVKAMQCLNIDTPLGQGLWEGVPLRDVLNTCGKIENVRRIYYWGFHNNDPKQIFRSSLSYTQVMETAPGELPVFLAYRLNGQEIPPERGGPVRMVVPWAHGFKSIKWLRWIALTNDFRANDTYANANNDPESFLKTAAYLDRMPEAFKVGEAIAVTGQVISGLSGLDRVEYWLRPAEEKPTPIADDHPDLLNAPWKPCELMPPPDWRQVLPAGVVPGDLLGFDRTTGKPLQWPPRYGMAEFQVTLRDLPAGRYEIRARAVDRNGFAQPQPRPAQKTGRNAIQVRRFSVG